MKYAYLPTPTQSTHLTFLFLLNPIERVHVQPFRIFLQIKLYIPVNSLRND